VTLRLDYLSPLPPVRSGIADYSLDLLPHLVERADVRVLRLPDLPLDGEIARRFAIAEGAERAGEDGRLPLYQMGNNRYHAAIHARASARPGIVVLHDFVLHHFLLDRTVGAGGWEPYRDELVADHGWIGEAAARAVRWGAFGRAAQFELPANRTLLQRQRGVLVHGAWAAERLAEDDPRLAVRVAPMPVPLPPPVERERGLAFRRARAIPEEAPLLGSFGFQTPIKRTDVAIRALARPGLETVHLLVAGELSPYARFEELAARLGVDRRVHVTGFLPFAELPAAIAATDLCLNLRYPSAGETSASLLRILAVGRPVVVSEYAEFGELPRSVALAVPLGEDEEERFAALVAERLAGGRGELAAMGACARAFVAGRHDPARAAEAILAAVAELAPLAPPGERAPEVPPKRSTASTTPRGTVEISNGSDWRPGELRRLRFEIENRGDDVWLPSRELPGGVVFEVQLWVGGRDRWQGRPWLELRAPLPPGTTRAVELPVRRPLEPARLVVKPKIATAEGFRPFGQWELERVL
jgi:glycosyltransferase involved in cell wall biosynthesis